jgi:23S rRNA (cytidine1920-2'-O)/16S rRNA (cytidine1409-2'-O)-methyltransferase
VELVRRGLFPTRALAQRAIAEGRVVVGGVTAARPSTLVAETGSVQVSAEGRRWASRGGFKLAAALQAFRVEPAGRRCLDVGASTGGFTDVLLAEGARAVVALDVGYGQLDWRLRADQRVTVVDRTNFRTVEPATLGAPFEVVVADVSFISLTLLSANLAACGGPGTEYVVLVKPQFEVGRDQVGRRGVVTDPQRHAVAVRRVTAAFLAQGLGPRRVCASPIAGASGNREFFLHARKGAPALLSEEEIDQAVGQ